MRDDSIFILVCNVDMLSTSCPNTYAKVYLFLRANHWRRRERNSASAAWWQQNMIRCGSWERVMATDGRLDLTEVKIWEWNTKPPRVSA